MRWPSDTILFSCDNKSFIIFFITSRDNVYHWCHIPVSTLCGNDPLLMSPCFWQQCRRIKAALAFYWSSRLLLTSSDWLSHENEWIATMHFCVYSQASLRGMNQMKYAYIMACFFVSEFAEDGRRHPRGAGQRPERAAERRLGKTRNNPECDCMLLWGYVGVVLR